MVNGRRDEMPVRPCPQIDILRFRNEVLARQVRHVPGSFHLGQRGRQIEMRIPVFARDRREKIIGCSHANGREHALAVLGSMGIESH